MIEMPEHLIWGNPTADYESTTSKDWVAVGLVVVEQVSYPTAPEVVESEADALDPLMALADIRR